MRFEFYHDGLEDVAKLSVDGLVPNSVHLTHWQGNETPAELRADTSTEIALNLVASPRREEITRGIIREDEETEPSTLKQILSGRTPRTTTAQPGLPVTRAYASAA